MLKRTENAAAYAFVINYTRVHDARLRKQMHIAHIPIEITRKTQTH